jgi:SAM-dependent methyltransferase
MSLYGGYDDDPDLAECYDFVPAYGPGVDVAFYLHHCLSTDGEILELGCGTGRVLIPAAQLGCRITGLDFSRGMLARCRRKLSTLSAEVRNRVTLLEGDMTCFELARQYSVIIIPFRPLEHLLEHQEQRSCFSAIRRHLLPGGVVAFDVSNSAAPGYGDRANPRGVVTVNCERPGGRLRECAITTASGGPHEGGCVGIETTYDVRDSSGASRRIQQLYKLHCYTVSDLFAHLKAVGLAAEQVSGDFDGSKYSEFSPEIICVARAGTSDETVPSTV